VIVDGYNTAYAVFIYRC